MKIPHPSSPDGAAQQLPPLALREQAEEVFLDLAVPSQEHLEDLSQETLRTLLHELRVHQIELEMQNEELRRTQLELADSRALYFDLYDQAPAGYITVGESGLILEANLTSANLLGITRRELIKQPLSRFILSADQDLYYRHRKHLLETGKPQSSELRLRKPDGTTVWARLDATSLRDENAAPACRVVLSNISASKRVEEALRSEIVRRKELEREVLAIAESEQRRIGQDLHDGICQELSGIQYVTELVAKRLPAELPEKELLAKTGADLRNVILHTRHLSHSLAPVDLDQRDLATALAELAANTETTFGIACTFSCPAPPRLPSSSTATHLYRIAQESVQNAIRHGRATAIHITLQPSGTGWVLQVADNGTPSPHENKSGRGLQIMRDRVHMFGGSLQFQRNAGTTMICTFSI